MDNPLRPKVGDIVDYQGITSIVIKSYPKCEGLEHCPCSYIRVQHKVGNDIVVRVINSDCYSAIRSIK